MPHFMQIILFDIDGTLIDSNGAGRKALNRAFAKAYSWEDSLSGVSLHGKTDPDIVETVYREQRETPPTPAELARFYGLYLLELRGTLQEADRFRVLPGVGRLLARLSVRENTFIGLATGNIEKGARAKLGRAGLNHRFSFGGFGSDAVERSDIVQAAVGRGMALLPDGARPSIWLIGDTPRDVEAGKTVGLKTIAVATGGADAETLRATEPDYFFDDLSDSVAFLSILDLAGNGIPKGSP